MGGYGTQNRTAGRGCATPPGSLICRRLPPGLSWSRNDTSAGEGLCPFAAQSVPPEPRLFPAAAPGTSSQDNRESSTSGSTHTVWTCLRSSSTSGASHHLLLPRCCWDLTCHRLRMAQRARWRQGHHPTALTGQDVHCPHQPQKAVSPPAVDLGFPRCCPKVTARKRTRQLGELTATKAHGRGTGLRST